MKAFRIVLDILIFLLLVAVLVWCAFLFWGAYSQHRISILVNKSVLKEIQTDIVNQVKGTQVPLDPNMTDENIKRLKEAQRELFDTNTMSFLFQFVTLVLVTIGVAVLGLMYGAYRRTREEAEKVLKRHDEIQKLMARFVKGRNSTIILAVQFSRLHVFGQMYLLCEWRQREDLRIMMSDHMKDVLRYLEEALQEGEGLEERLFVDIAFDAALKNNLELKRIRDGVQGFEKDAIQRILDMSTECLEILRENGGELVSRFNAQWKEITGENDES